MTNKDWSGNANSIWKTLGASNHTDEEREADDYYATDPIAIDKLLSVERPNTNIWECACGAGHLSERLKQHGYSVYSTDIVERGYCDKLIDFLANDSVPPPPRHTTLSRIRRTSTVWNLSNGHWRFCRLGVSVICS